MLLLAPARSQVRPQVGPGRLCPQPLLLVLLQPPGWAAPAAAVGVAHRLLCLAEMAAHTRTKPEAHEYEGEAAKRTCRNT